MSHNPYKYHILKSTVPDALMSSHGYPENCRHSQGNTWIIFDGQKTTDLESAFDDHLPDDPLPGYCSGKAVNLTQDEAHAIVITEGADETLGWIAVQ